MTKFDTTFRNLAKQLIDDTFGTSAVITRETPSYDPVTGDNSKSETTYSVKISPPAPISRHRLRDGSLYEMQDLTCMVAAITLAIEPNAVTDKLTYRNRVYQIVDVIPAVSGDQDAAYELVVRR